MYTKERIILKLNELKAACIASGSTLTPDGLVVVTGAEKAAVLDAVYAVVDVYYAFDDTLRTQVMYIIHQLYGDIVRRHTVYHGGAEPPPCREDYPAGYDDVSALFTCDGAYGVMTGIVPAEFIESIEIDSAGGVSSEIAEMWAAQIGGARAGEMTALETLLNF